MPDDFASKLKNIEDARRDKAPEPTAPAPISANLRQCPTTDPSYPDCDGTYDEPTSDPDYATPRTLPQNETGGPGVDLGSRNFNWSTPLLNLPGRAGLDVNLSLVYNSLVWTKQGASIRFNADRGFPGVGFHLGFPTIQQQYYNSQIGAYAYMMITPSGGRVEMRYVGTSGTTGIYESADSSYTQMLAYDNGWALVRTTDGTKYTFAPSVNGEKRCVEIKDRNGNAVSVGYNTLGYVTTITDTLGRVVTFNYDADENLSYISQPRTGMESTLVTFGYGPLTIQHNFPGLNVNGAANGSSVRVLTQVGFADGSYYRFHYTSWGQVWKIAHHAQDNHELSYTAYNLPGSPLLGSSAQSDCPRFTERRDSIEYGVMNGSAETVTSYSVAADGSWSQVTMPDGTIHKEFFATSGWANGLTTQTEIWSGGARRKWTTVGYTQDDPNLPYQKNPRVAETNIYDEAGNRRRTTIDYGPYAQYGLPYIVYEYAANGTTLLRASYTDYRLDQAYLDGRIIGLVSARHVFDITTTQWTLVSKIDYYYDATGEYLENQGAATQHDPNVGQWRGNLIQERRWDVDAPGDVNRSVSNYTGYNTTGSVIFTRDQLGHQTVASYNDNFVDGVNRNTFAYPNTVNDADEYSVNMQYKYETGALTARRTPQPNTTQNTAGGPTETMEYDGVGRILRVTNTANGAYTRWEYPAAMNSKKSYTTMVAGTELYSIEYYDGAGRGRATASQHPGSVGGFRGVHLWRDSMGRVIYTSNPTEITDGWAAVGDDHYPAEYRTDHCTRATGREKGTVRQCSSGGSERAPSY